MGEIQEGRKEGSEQHSCCVKREEVHSRYIAGQESGEANHERWRSCEDRCCAKSPVGQGQESSEEGRAG